MSDAVTWVNTHPTLFWFLCAVTNLPVALLMIRSLAEGAWVDNGERIILGTLFVLLVGAGPITILMFVSFALLVGPLWLIGWLVTLGK